MAALTSTSIAADASAVTATVNTLTASDTLTYDGKHSRQLLEIANGTGASLTVNLLGDEAATFTVSGYGSVDPTSGYDIVVADGATVSVILSGLDKYIEDSDGSIAVTGGTDATAILYDIN